MSNHIASARNRWLRNALALVVGLAMLPAVVFLSATPAGAEAVGITVYDGSNQSGNELSFAESGYYDLSTYGWAGRIRSWRVAAKYPTSGYSADGLCLNLYGVDGPVGNTFIPPGTITKLDIGRTCLTQAEIFSTPNYGAPEPTNCKADQSQLIGWGGAGEDICADPSVASSICKPMVACASPAVPIESILLPYGGIAAVYAFKDDACTTLTYSVADLSATGGAGVVVPGVGCEHAAWRYNPQDLTAPAAESFGDVPDIPANTTYVVRCPSLEMKAYSGPAFTGEQTSVYTGPPGDGVLVGALGPDGTGVPFGATRAKSFRCLFQLISGQDDQPDGVALYTSPDFNGLSAISAPPIEDPTIRLLGFNVHSIVNPLPTPVSLYADSHFRGACLEVAPASYVADLTKTLLGTRAPQSIGLGACPPAPVLELADVHSGSSIIAETPLVLTRDISDLNTVPAGSLGYSVSNPTDAAVAVYTGVAYTGTCTTVLPGQDVNLEDTAIGADNAKSLWYNRPCPGDVVPQTLYVDPSGTSDTCDAPAGGACASPQQAIDRAETHFVATDAVTIDIAAGDYTGNFTIGGTDLNSLVIAGAGAGKTVLDGNGSGSVLTLPYPSGTPEAVIVENVTITGGNSGAGAGGVSSRAPLLTLSNDEIRNNTGKWGGVLNLAPGGLYLWNDTLDHNTGSTTGALGAEGATAVINTTIAANTADDGPGGVLVNTGNVRFLNDTFAGNIDRNTTGQPVVFNDLLNASSGANVRLTNSIIADANACFAIPADPNNPGGFGGGHFVDGGYNVEAGNTCSFGDTSIVNSTNINLGPLTAISAHDERKTMAIDRSSSAFEEVPTAACTQHTDEQHMPRPGVPDKACDAGAFEYQQPKIFVTVGVAESFGGVPHYYVADNRPNGVTLTGSASCTTAGGTPIDQLHPGFYTPDVASCSGLSVTDYTLVYLPTWVWVTPAVPTQPTITNVPHPPDTGTSFTAQIATTGDGATFVISLTPDVCHVGTDGRTVSFLTAGTCTLVPNVEHGTDYLDASGPQESFQVYTKPTFTSAASANFTYAQQGGFAVTTAGVPVPSLNLLSALPDGLTFAASNDGTATITGAPTSPAGSYPVTIAATNLGGSTMQTLTIVVNRATPTQPFITNLPNPGVVGNSFLAEVYTDGDGVTSVSSSTTGICSVDADGLTVELTAVGTCQLTAAVAAGARYAAAIGTVQSFQVDEPPAFVSAASTVFTVGMPGTFTVTAAGAPTPVLTLLDGLLPSGVSFTPHSDGTATITGTAGSGSVGTYLTDLAATNVLDQATQAFTLHVQVATPTVTASASAVGTTYGSPFSITASVAAPLGDVLTPSGSVSFFVDGASAPAATVALSGGSATWTTAALHAGSHTIVAEYLGDPNFGSVTAAPASLEVAPAATTVRASSLVSTQFIPTARLTRTDNGAPLAGLTIVFNTGGRTVCTAITDAQGYARCSKKNRVTSQAGITATFAGTGDYKPSTGTAPFR